MYLQKLSYRRKSSPYFTNRTNTDVTIKCSWNINASEKRVRCTDSLLNHKSPENCKEGFFWRTDGTNRFWISQSDISLLRHRLIYLEPMDTVEFSWKFCTRQIMVILRNYMILFLVHLLWLAWAVRLVVAALIWATYKQTLSNFWFAWKTP